MSDLSPHQIQGSSSPPPKGIPSSPSIFAYQTRLLTRTSSSSTNLTSPSASGSLAAMAGGSPPSTPIRRNVARMIAEGNGVSGQPATGREVGLGIGMGHRPKGRSVDLVRGWEAKISQASDLQGNNASPTKSVSRQTTMPPPPIPSSSQVTSDPFAADPTSTNTSITASPVSDTASVTPLAQKRSTVSSMDGFHVDKAVLESDRSSSSASRVRPASISSYSTLLTPHSTGDSSVTSARSQATEDRIAKAKANALKRREAKAAAAGAPLDTVKPVSTPTAEVAESVPTIKASPKTERVTAPHDSTPVKSSPSPFSKLFEPPSADSDATPKRPVDATPKTSSRLSAREVFEKSSSSAAAETPATATSAPKYVPSGLSLGHPPADASGLAPPTAGSSKDKYGSISKTDRRRLGRHLPRIASGGEGWEEEGGPSTGRTASGHPRVPSTLGRDELKDAKDAPLVSPVKPAFTSASAPSRPRATEVLTPSTAPNVPPASPVSAPTSSVSKRRSAYLNQAGKPELPTGVGITSPRPELAGADMKGLMKDVGSMSNRTVSRDAEGVTGMSNRLRLTKNALPPSASSRALAPTPLPSRRLIQPNWMDRQRHDLHAYEYLCHVGEAQQWIEGCLDEELSFGVTELEEGLVDGVVLAKLAQRLQEEGVVRSIYTEGKHRYKQTENINHFLKFIRSVGMPETFIFETTDLYNRRNVPKVIFAIHVLSHLLARLGKAERIGNLVGQFEFTDEQLKATQKGLQGVAMPNFGDARNTLAKEASWEPEEPEESEDERRDRLLLECEPDIIQLQCHLRGRLASQRAARIQAQLDLAGPIINRFQARARGALCRRELRAIHEERSQLHDWSTSLQATAKAHLASRQWQTRVERIRRAEQNVAGLQAQVRGVLARLRRAKVQHSIDQSAKSLVRLQAVCRGCLARRDRKQTRQTLVAPQAIASVTSLQAVLRGRLRRQAAAKQQTVIYGQTPTFVSLQSHLRGALVRRRQRANEQKLDDATDYIVAIQATARGVLARRKKQALGQAVQHAFASVSALQAVARGRLAQKSHKSMQKALAKVEVAGSVGGLQAFLRTKLAKKQTTEQKKKLEFVQPDVIGFQAVARGYLARQEYREWRDYLQDPHTQGALVFLQSLVRGFLARRRLWYRTSFLHTNVDKVVKIQALWRGRQERLTYSRLVTGQDVDVPTVQRYMHLLDDTETDFQDQIRIESMRKEVMDLVRTNQSLETEVKELDTKIALIVNNKMTFEELARAKRRTGGQDGAAAQFHHNINNDPFSTGGGAHMDRASQRKLELYEHLFFTLQTQPQYLSRLLRAMSQDESADKDRKLVESVALILFGYERREEYLFHKLLQLSIHEEILRSASLAPLYEARFAIVPIASQYIKPSLADYVQLALEKNVMRIIQAPELDLCTDPVELYHRSINAEETQTGLPSSRPRNLDADQVLQTDAHARAEYIQHLQELRFLCVETIKGLVKSTVQLPYTIKMMARETLLALRIKYPDAYDEDLTPIIARTVILPFILPALIAPETYGIVDQPIGPVERRNLAAVANLLTHVAAQEDPNSLKDRFVRVPLQEYIKSEGPILRDWIMDVADVEPLEGYFQAHEMLESTLEAKPISITRTEIYGMLSILMRQIPVLTNKKAQDPIAAVLEELEGPPIDYDKTKIPVMLRLTNRFADLKPGEDSRIKEDWVQAKRHVLAVLRVQTGRTLYDVLVSRPEEIDEVRWIEEVHRDIALENARIGRHNLPPTPAEAGYQIESIRSLPFHEVKSRAIVYCIKLEKAGKISRGDAYQGLLHSIASDIRQKHHLRKMRKQNLTAMTRAHDDLRHKKAGFDEQVKSYHDYIDSSMASLQQKGKKKPMFLSKQYRHQRALAKEGKGAQFGSYTYTAADLNEKGVLLKIHDFSPRQYDKVQISISSNEVGIFTIDMIAPTLNLNGNGPAPDSAAGLGSEQIRMEDLLQAQFDNEQNLVLFDGMASFSINMLIHQINKKFYA